MDDSQPRTHELLRTLVDRLPSMVAYWDAGLRCCFANRAYERWFGVSPESLLGKHISELLGRLYPLNLPYIQAALRGESQEFEREIPDPAGGPSRHSLANYIPHVVDGAVRGFFVLVTDISAIKRAQLALGESEERFRLTLDEAPIGMALVALDGRFIRVNRALCAIVGYGEAELTGLSFRAITHPDDLDADLGLAERLFRGEIPSCQLEKRYLRKDGTVVDILLSGSVLRGRDGAAIHYIAQIEDISERKRLERELRVAEATSSGILSISADAIISIDEQQRISLFNEGAERMFGHSQAEALGAPLDLLIPERFRAVHGSTWRGSRQEAARPTGSTSARAPSSACAATGRSSPPTRPSPTSRSTDGRSSPSCSATSPSRSAASESSGSSPSSGPSWPARSTTRRP
jgi:PAS domain S-box-containing protein